MPRPKGNPSAFPLHALVRYKPSQGTYGYEDATKDQEDGRIPAQVVGHSAKRVRIRFRNATAGIVVRAVDAASLILAPTVQQ